MVEERFNLDRKDVEKRLQGIVQQNRGAVVVFAARCALRAFPLLAYQGNFDYWLSRDKQNVSQTDCRAEYLLALWSASLIAWWAHLQEPASISNAEKQYIASIRKGAEAAAHATTTDANAAYAATVTVNAVAAADVHALVDVLADAFATAGTVGPAAAAAAIHVTDNNVLEYLEHAIIDDLEQLEATTSWEGIPLWNNTSLPKNLSYTVDKHLAKALQKLAREEEGKGNTEAARKVDQIYPTYMSLLQGKAGLQSILEVLAMLDANDQPESANRSISGQPSTIVYKPTPRTQNELAHGEDSLDRTNLAQALVTIIRAPENKEHLTVGLIGDWGAGKSFLLNLVKEQLQHQPSGQKKETVDFLVGEFNAWAYEHSDNTHAGVAQEAIAALTQPVLREPLPEKFMSWARFKHWLAGGWIKTRLAVSFVIHHHLLRLITWVVLIALAFYVLYWVFADEEREIKHIEYLFGTVSLFAIVKGYLMLKGALLSPLAKVFRTYLKLPTYGEHLGQVPVMREHLRLLCDLRLKTKTVKGSKHQTRLLYIIDDLDRCGPEGIVKTFEAVRLMMDIPQVTVMIAVDHRIALAALAHHYDAMAKYQAGRPEVVIARDYLAKVIHLPIALGQSDSAVVDRYLSALLGQQDTAVAPDKESLPAAESNEADGTDRETGNPVRGEAPSDPAEQEGLQRDGPIEDNDGSIAPKPPAPLEALGMSPEHSQGLRYWVRLFGLHNPRQLKRLFNSYNLMRHYYGEEEEPVAVAGVEGDKEENVSELAQYAFPRMVGLLLLEWLNEQSVEIRKPLLDAIQKGAGPELPKTTQTPDAVYNAIAVLSQSAAGYHQVAPFVLPALDPEMERQS